jgi:hypothetical protein
MINSKLFEKNIFSNKKNGECAMSDQQFDPKQQAAIVENALIWKEFCL